MKTNLIAFFIIAAVVSLVLAIMISPFASSYPDGLEKVAEDKGFLEKGEEWSLWNYSPIPDYVFPGFGESPLATSIAGFFGTIFVFIGGYLIALVLKNKKKNSSNNL